MDISVTKFRAQCLKLIRRAAQGGEAVNIRRRGRIVARLSSPMSEVSAQQKPWERLRGSGRLLAGPDESVLEADDFVALR